MIGLRQCDSDTLAFYRKRVIDYCEIADGIGAPAFSKTLRSDLLKTLGDAESVRLVEAVTRIGQFGDVQHLRSRDLAVKKILNRKGIRLPKGKRPHHPGLAPLVERLAPLLLALGVERATGEYSHLVGALRAIAYELGVTGDPRDMLRKAVRQERNLGAKAYHDFLEAFAHGIAPDTE